MATLLFAKSNDSSTTKSTENPHMKIREVRIFDGIRPLLIAAANITRE
jgi:hypothetical protein